jgi:hypothetical protein
MVVVCVEMLVAKALRDYDTRTLQTLFMMLSLKRSLIVDGLSDSNPLWIRKLWILKWFMMKSKSYL